MRGVDCRPGMAGLRKPRLWAPGLLGKMLEKRLLNPLQGSWEFGSEDPPGSCSLEIQLFCETSRSHLSAVIKWKGRKGEDP